MMEQSDTFTGWSLSEKDFDYVGGNIPPNPVCFTDLTGNNLAPNIHGRLQRWITAMEIARHYIRALIQAMLIKDTLKWLNPVYAETKYRLYILDVGQG